MSSSSLQNYLSGIGLSTTAPSSSTGTNASSTGTNSNTLTQADFLTLLTTQMTHQDPTNPTDSNTMVQQMSEFSTVSGIDTLVSDFQNLSTSLTSSQTLQASSLVGQSVYAPSNQALLTSGGTVSGNFTLATATTDATLTITDPKTNATIDQIDLGSQAAGQIPFVWDGKTSSGATATPGVYNVAVTAMVNGKNTAQTTNILSQVSSVTLGSSGSGTSGLQLNLAGLNTSVPFSSVTTIQ